MPAILYVQPLSGQQVPLTITTGLATSSNSFSSARTHCQYSMHPHRIALVGLLLVLCPQLSPSQFTRSHMPRRRPHAPPLHAVCPDTFCLVGFAHAGRRVAPRVSHVRRRRRHRPPRRGQLREMKSARQHPTGARWGLGVGSRLRLANEGRQRNPPGNPL